jgi:hypothetical protein
MRSVSKGTARTFRPYSRRANETMAEPSHFFGFELELQIALDRAALTGVSSSAEQLNHISHAHYRFRSHIDWEDLLLDDSRIRELAGLVRRLWLALSSPSAGSGYAQLDRGAGPVPTDNTLLICSLGHVALATIRR